MNNSRKEGMIVISPDKRDPEKKERNMRGLLFLIILSIIVLIIPLILLIWMVLKVLLFYPNPYLGIDSPLFPAAMIVGISSFIGWSLFYLQIDSALTRYLQKIRNQQITSEETLVGRIFFRTNWTVGFLLFSVTVIYVPFLLAIWFVIHEPSAFFIPSLGMLDGYKPGVILLKFFRGRHKIKQKPGGQ